MEVAAAAAEVAEEGGAREFPLSMWRPEDDTSWLPALHGRRALQCMIEEQGAETGSIVISCQHSTLFLL